MDQPVVLLGSAELTRHSVVLCSLGGQLCWSWLGSLMCLGAGWLLAGLGWPWLGQLGSPAYGFSSPTGLFSWQLGRVPREQNH